MLIICGPKNDIRRFNIYIPDWPKKVGITVSGGADSAILLYIVALLNKQRPNPAELIPFTVPRTDGAYLYSPDIVEYVNQRLNLKLPVPLSVGDPTVHHSKQVETGTMAMLDNGIVDYIFYGSQQTPPEEFPMPGLYPERPSHNKYKRAQVPFVDLYKTHTLDLYYQFGQEKLLELSHSCTEMQIGRCGQCFQCAEREWAFRILGKKDPGLK
jgi:hypothetical protein